MDISYTGAVRLSGGMYGSGQVEIFLGRWGSIVAGGHWNERAAQVVCQEMGFSGGTPTATEPVDTRESSTPYEVGRYKAAEI